MNPFDTTQNRHKGGRDKSPDPRAHIVQTRLTGDELAAIRRRASAQHVTVSDYLRRAALAGAKPNRRRKAAEPEPHPFDPALMFELHKIGVNLNQIARLYNSGVFAPEALTQACERFNTLLDKYHV
jgi:Bacterial mobilisation protein (MobC)